MNLKARIQVFTELSEYLKTDIYQQATEQLQLAEVLNPWFTQGNIEIALNRVLGLLAPLVIPAGLLK